MRQIDHLRRRPRVFNTPLETGLRSVIILTTCFPDRLSLHRLVVFDHLIVHTADIGGPESMHPEDRSRAAEILVRRRLVESGLALMETRGLITRVATPQGFRYQAGEEAGSFVDLLTTTYSEALKERADWLVENVLPLTDDALASLVRSRMDEWEPEFQSDQSQIS
jgi:hypothetical protein